MQAIPINFSYGKNKAKAQRRSSEPHIYKHNPTKHNNKRVLNRFGIIALNQSNPTYPTHPKTTNNSTKTSSISISNSNQKQQQSILISKNHLRTPQKPQQSSKPPNITLQTNHKAKPKPKPKPNRNFYHKKKIPKTPSRSHHNHSHSLDRDYTITPLPSHLKLNNNNNNNNNNFVRKRSQSCSMSRSQYNNEYSHLNESKAYTNRLPTHYSPSITHYTPSVDLNDETHTPEITPPPMQQLPPSRDSIHVHIRNRTRSLSHNDSSYSHKQNKNKNKNRNKNNCNKINVAHILRMSDIENEKEMKNAYEVTEIQINNGKSLKIFSSWFSLNDNDNSDDNDNEINLNQFDIDNAINSINDINSSIENENENENDKILSPQVGVVRERNHNPTFTTGLKPPRKYTTEREDINNNNNNNNDNAKEEVISFRDFLAQENRKALQNEVVNTENQVDNNNNNNNMNNINMNEMDRFEILAGNTIKVDYGLPEGPYTLYKFIITYNHKYRRQNTKFQKVKSAESYIAPINLEYDESPTKKTSHWSIRKRYSDFVTFNNNLITEIKEMSKMSKTIKLPKLPPKTFKKNFNLSFVTQRHNLLLIYLNKIITIRELQSSVTLLTFLGAINNHELPYNDKFLDARMRLSLYISNYADTGDVLLFETKSYIAASLRSVTSSNYDHVALVYRDIHGTHKCTGDNNNHMHINNNRLYLIESTVDGVRTYPLKSRLKQWSLLCPQIVVRRLKLLKPGIQESKINMNKDWQSSSLNSIKKYDENEIYTKFDFQQKTNKFYNLSKEFIDKVNGSDYAIWSNVFRLSDVPIEKQKSFFCSQLVTAFFKFMDLLPSNVKTNRILPGHFSDELSNKIKLPMKNCLLLKENLLLFKLPNINNAKHAAHHTTNKRNNHYMYNR